MKRILLSIAFIICALSAVMAQNGKFVSVSDPNVLTEGRFITNSDSKSFCYPGTAFSIWFTGTSCRVQLKPSAGYL